MQKTKTYELNLIEMSDTFSPDPINANTQKIEQELKTTRSALDAETAARQSAVSAENSAWRAALDAETAARQSAVSAENSAWRAALDAETAARQSAVSAGNSAWQTALDTEIAARKSADSSEATARQASITALDGRVKTIEAKRVVVGTYSGASGDTRTISLGFTPRFLLLSSNVRDYGAFTILTPGNPTIASTSNRKECVKIVADGFQLPKFTPAGGTVNGNINPFDQTGYVYIYIACD